MNDNKTPRPLILVSNDDGYYAGGIKELTRIAGDYGDVLVVAPATHQSGQASAITISVPVVAHKVEEREGFIGYSVVGTPADCAKLAIDQCLGGRMPDLVLSGINHGFNSGNSVIYSGTMGVVFEGLFHGIHSVAFSYGSYGQHTDFSPCEPVVRHVIERVLAQGLPPHVCLNVNIPLVEHATDLKGVKVTRGALGRWQGEFEHRVNPFGEDYYWITGDFVEEDPNDTLNDTYWLKRGWVSVTPVHADQTDYEAMDTIAALVGNKDN